MNAAFDQTARDEHVRKTTVKEIWGRFVKARAEGNTSDALGYCWDMPGGRTGNAKAQVYLQPTQYSQLDDLIQSECVQKC